MDSVYIETSIISHATAGPTSDMATLNCRHIANATALPRIYRLLDELGLSGVLICTPIEFPGGSNANQPNP